MIEPIPCKVPLFRLFFEAEKKAKLQQEDAKALLKKIKGEVEVRGRKNLKSRKRPCLLPMKKS